MQNNSAAMKLFVVNMLKEQLPPFYYYHNYDHTLYVMDKVVEIGTQENCTDHDLYLLSAAALFHDAGFISTYSNHEKESCQLARRYLPDYGYSAEDIDAICTIIMATKMPQSPKNKLGMIIADADLEYLGTASVADKAEDLFRELQQLNPRFGRQQWAKMQVAFLESHHYFTRYCKLHKQPVKQLYLERLLGERV